MSDFLRAHRWWFIGPLLVLLVLLAFWGLVASDAAYDKHCAALGGHVRHSTIAGKVTTTYCLSPDGDVLEKQ